MAAVYKKYKVKKLLLGIALFNAAASPALVKGEDYVAATDPQALQYIQTKNAELTYESEEIDRELDDATLGWKPKLTIGTHFKISTEVEAAGSGTAANPVAYDGLFQIAAMASDSTSTTHVDYSELDDDSWPDATVYFYMDGVLHKLLNCQANVSCAFANKTAPTFKSEITGVYGGVVSAAVPQPTFTQVKPVPVSNQYTTILLDGVQYVLVNFSWDKKAEVSYSNLPGYEGVSLDDFAPEGEIEILRPALSDFDPFAISRSEEDTFLSLELNHGKTAGNSLKISNPEIQLLTPSYSEFEGKSTYKIPYGCVGATAIRTF